MIQEIELPYEFFPASLVVIDYSSTEEIYPVTVYGFDGNEIYQERTNIFLMRDEENITSIAEIGEYICNVMTLKDED
jgi:hypothetical protein